jgi:hypothetical protein
MDASGVRPAYSGRGRAKTCHRRSSSARQPTGEARSGIGAQAVVGVVARRSAEEFGSEKGGFMVWHASESALRG